MKKFALRPCVYCNTTTSPALPRCRADHTRVKQRIFMSCREQGPCRAKPVLDLLNMDAQDRQDKQAAVFDLEMKTNHEKTRIGTNKDEAPSMTSGARVGRPDDAVEGIRRANSLRADGRPLGDSRLPASPGPAVPGGSFESQTIRNQQSLRDQPQRLSVPSSFFVPLRG